MFKEDQKKKHAITTKYTQKCDFIYLGEILCSKYMYQKRKLSVSITSSKLPSLARKEDSPPNISTVKTKVWLTI